MHGHSKNAEYLHHLFLPSNFVKITIYYKTTETYSIVLNHSFSHYFSMHGHCKGAQLQYYTYFCFISL